MGVASVRCKGSDRVTIRRIMRFIDGESTFYYIPASERSKRKFALSAHRKFQPSIYVVSLYLIEMERPLIGIQGTRMQNSAAPDSFKTHSSPASAGYSLGAEERTKWKQNLRGAAPRIQ